MYRVGLGVDMHSFADPGSGRPLMLGGVAVPGAGGLAGHSDADVLTHAICDALLGAAGLSDLGSHFPDDDPGLAGVSSMVLLEKVNDLVRQRGYRIVNIDAVIIAQQPRLAAHLAEMGRRLAGVLGIAEEDANIKATSPEGLTSLGRKEGIAAQAVVLLRRGDDAE